MCTQWWSRRRLIVQKHHQKCISALALVGFTELHQAVSESFGLSDFAKRANACCHAMLTI